MLSSAPGWGPDEQESSADTLLYVHAAEGKKNNKKHVERTLSCGDLYHQLSGLQEEQSYSFGWTPTLIPISFIGRIQWDHGKGLSEVSHKTYIILPGTLVVTSFGQVSSIGSGDEYLAVLSVRDMRLGRVFLSPAMPELQCTCSSGPYCIAEQCMFDCRGCVTLLS